MLAMSFGTSRCALNPGGTPASNSNGSMLNRPCVLQSDEANQNHVKRARVKVWQHVQRGGCESLADAAASWLHKVEAPPGALSWSVGSIGLADAGDAGANGRSRGRSEKILLNQPVTSFLPSLSVTSCVCLGKTSAH